MSVFDSSNISVPIEQWQLFDGEYSGFQRMDVVRYPVLDKLFKRMRGDFWIPEVTNMSQDAVGVFTLPDNVQQLYRENLLYQTTADSIVDRGIRQILSTRVSDPILERLLSVWAFSESIHSTSYSHIVQSVYGQSTEFFDSIADNQFIIDRFNDEVKAFSMDTDIELLLLSLLALESVKFMVSFSYTYMINEQFENHIPGTATIIRTINNDENNHMIAGAAILKILRDTPREGGLEFSSQMDLYEPLFEHVVQGELEWADHLMNIYPLQGINLESMEVFIRWCVNRGLKAANLPVLKGGEPNSLVKGFLQNYNINDSVVAGQEADSGNYQIGRMENDWND